MGEVQSLRPEPEALINIEAEQQFIGALLTNNDLLRAVPEIEAEHFADPAHQRIMTAILAKVAAGDLASPVTLKVEMHEALKDLGGAVYLARLAGSAAGSHIIRDYADVIRALWARRAVRQVLEDGAEAIGRPDTGSALDVAGAVEAHLGRIQMAAAKKPLSVSILSAMSQSITKIAEAYNGDTGLAGISTGLRALDDLIGGFAAGRCYVLAGRPAMGKAQPLTSMVLTCQGWKPMGALRVGDGLCSIDGAPSAVTAIHPQGERRVVRVTFSDGRSALCCEDHLWEVRSSKFDGPRVLTAEGIRKKLTQERYQRRLYVPLFEGHFGGGDLPIDPYLLGVIIGNGSITSSVKITDRHAETMARVQSALPSGMSLVQHDSLHWSITTPAGKANPITDRLRALGLMGKKSEAKFLPPAYLAASRSDRLALLRGLIDTDGWVESFGAVRFSTSSARLADDVQKLAWSLGCVCPASEKQPFFTYKGERKAGLPHYVLSIRHPQPETLMMLPKKQDRAIRKHPPRLTIVSVEPAGWEPVQCITVSHPSHLYATDGYVMTHNSASALNISVRAALRGDGVWFGSLEMPATELANRFFSQMLADRGIKVPYSDIERGKLDEMELRALMGVAKDFEALPLDIGDPNTRTFAKVRAAAKRSQDRMNGRMRLVAIDYLQKLIPPGNLRDLERISAAAEFCKNLALEMEMPVLALAQLSRSVEARDNKRPMLSDLRGSGEIEQEADTVIFAYRDAYYLENMIKGERDGARKVDMFHQLERTRNDLELIVAKQRGGRTGTALQVCDLAFNVIADKPQDELPYD